jgi:hypothetical protein
MGACCSCYSMGGGGAPAAPAARWPAGVDCSLLGVAELMPC